MADYISKYSGEEIDSAIDRANKAILPGGYAEKAITLSYAPTSNNDAVHKKYVDNRINALKEYLDNVIKTYHPEYVPTDLPEYSS